MPNYWETSARPLFVKTVFVNGNRHAILFDEDPLLRCGNSPLKKISRPNSSLSFASELSISCSESHDSNFETKHFKMRNTHQRPRKDLSSELQSCLVKLKLASGNLKNKNKSEEKFFNEEEINSGKENESTKRKEHKRNYGRMCKRKLFCEDSKEFQPTGGKNEQGGCFVCNLENLKGKKNYCFLKINSHSPQLILKCSCEEDWNETQNYNLNNNHNLVINATIHDLIMQSARNDYRSVTEFDYVLPLENAELYWNNYLTKSYFNSLSEKVFQWLDLASKRKKQKEKLNSTGEESLNDNPERIFSGKKFVEQIRKTECFYRKDNKITESEDVEREVVGELNVETLLSRDNFKERLPEKNQASRKPPAEEQKTPNSGNLSPAAKTNSLSKPNRMPCINLQDVSLNYRAKENITFRSKKKIRETRRNPDRQSKHKEAYNSEDEKDFIVTTINSWEGRFCKKGDHPDKFDSNAKQCRSGRSFDECVDKIKNPILTEEFSPEYQKSINNLNITRTTPVFIQNLLSPQQPDEVSYSKEEKIFWASEKNTRRPQLHIFMPSILLRDQSDDSTSECEFLS